jgi:hypothetical protein
MSHRLAPHDRARGAMKRCHLALGVLGEDPPKAAVMGGDALEVHVNGFIQRTSVRNSWE